MDNENAPLPCLTYLFIVSGILLAVIAALLLSQIDSLQKRTSLPQPTLQSIDLDATLAAGDLTVVVITGEASQSDFPTITPTLPPDTTTDTTAATADLVPVEGTPESPTMQFISPLCSDIPHGWLPYRVQAKDTLRSLAIDYRVDEDSLAQVNCLNQPQLKAGQIIYLPVIPEVTAEKTKPWSQDS
jgi:hypothetical protein